MKRMGLLFLCAFVLSASGTSFGENSSGEEKEPSVEELARELANPNTPLASLTFKNQYRFFSGDLPHSDDQHNYTLLFQPVFPFGLGTTASGGKANLFVRPAFPIMFDQPVFDSDKNDFRGVSALGDIGYGVTEESNDEIGKCA